MGATLCKSNELITYSIDNRLDKVKILYKNKAKYNNDAFNYACLNSSYEVVTWLCQFKLELYKDTLLNLIQDSNLEIIIILVNYKKIQINDSIFELSCSYDFNISLWLYEMGIKDIDLRNNNALLNALLHNKQDIVEWLLKKGDDIEKNDDYIFKDLCKEKKLYLVKQLSKMNKRYKYAILNNEVVPMIKSKDIYYIENKFWRKLIKCYEIYTNDNFTSDECAISFEDSNFITNCNHHFKIDEIMSWYLKKNTCPLCETKIVLNKCIVDKSILDAYQK